MVFVSKSCMSRKQSRIGNMGRRLDTRRPASPMKRNNVEVYPLTVTYITQTWLAWHQRILSARLASTFYL